MFPYNFLATKYKKITFKDLMIQFGVVFFCAIRANAVAKIRFRMVSDIGFDLTPISFVITDVFTPGTDRQHPT